MSRADVRYVCQRAANAIITEIGPYRVSSDALQSINQFLDEFLVLLLSTSLSFDLSRIKNAVFDILPSSSLGKNAIVEAELEVKTFTETEAIDYGIHERMRRLGTNGQPFPLERALVLLRGKCVEFCALADKDEDDSLPPLPPTQTKGTGTMKQKNTKTKEEERENGNMDMDDEVVISPVVVIYITTVLEHIAEYILTAIALVAENEDTEYIRVREVFLGLNEDIQVGAMFHRSELREKLEKRASAYGYHVHHHHQNHHQLPHPPSSPLAPPSGHLPSPAPSPVTSFKKHTSARDSVVKGDSYYDTTAFDDSHRFDDDDDYEKHDRHGHLSMYSIRSNDSTQSRPISMMSNSTSNGTIRTSASSSSKKGFKLFKRDKRASVALETPAQRASMPVTVSVYNPDAPCLNFDDLIRSGNTMRVSLTPNRLRSIEVHDQMADDDDDYEADEDGDREEDIDRFRDEEKASFRLSRRETTWHSGLNNSAEKERHLRPVSPPTTGRVGQRMDMARHEKPIISRPQPAKKSDLAELHAPFENPRSAPKPPGMQQHNSHGHTTNGHGEKVDQTLPTPASSITSQPSQSRQTSSLELPEVPGKDEIGERAYNSSSSSSNNSSPKHRPLALPSSSGRSVTGQADTRWNGSKRTTLPTSMSHQSIKPTRRARSTLLSDEEDRKVHFDREHGVHTNGRLHQQQQQQQQQQPQPVPLVRPSSMVAQRASMISSRPQSFHESFALNMDKRTFSAPNRASTAGSVEMSIKAWDEMLGQQHTLHRTSDNTIPVIRRRADGGLSQARSKFDSKEIKISSEGSGDEQQEKKEKEEDKVDHAVLDKVQKYERTQADLQDEPVISRAASLSGLRRQQQQPPQQQEKRANEIVHTLHRKTTPITSITHRSRNNSNDDSNKEPLVLSAKKEATAAALSVHMGVQTDPLACRCLSSLKPVTDSTTSLLSVEGKYNRGKDMDAVSILSERGVLEGDEEWFLQDEDWEDTQEQENAVVEWLLGDA